MSLFQDRLDTFEDCLYGVDIWLRTIRTEALRYSADSHLLLIREHPAIVAIYNVIPVMQEHICEIRALNEIQVRLTWLSDHWQGLVVNIESLGKVVCDDALAKYRLHDDYYWERLNDYVDEGGEALVSLLKYEVADGELKEPFARSIKDKANDANDEDANDEAECDKELVIPQRPIEPRWFTIYETLMHKVLFPLSLVFLGLMIGLAIGEVSLSPVKEIRQANGTYEALVEIPAEINGVKQTNAGKRDWVIILSPMPKGK